MSNLRMSERVNQGQTFKKQPMSSISTFKVQAASGAIPKTNSNYNSSSRRICRLCDEEHYWPSCPKFKSPEDRRNRVMSMGWCLMCLQKGHVSDECSINARYKCDSSSCQYKDHPHNIGLCGSSYSRSKAQNFKTSVTPNKVSHDKNKKYDSRVSTNPSQ